MATHRIADLSFCHRRIPAAASHSFLTELAKHMEHPITRGAPIYASVWKTLCHAFLLAAIVSGGNPSSGRADERTNEAGGSDVEQLKRRVEELESQNRRMLILLMQLKAQLDQMGGKNSANIKAHGVMGATGSAFLQSDTPASLMPAVHSTTIGASSSAASGAINRVASVPPAKNEAVEPVQWPELIAAGNRVKFYGSLRLDLDVDSQSPNNAQIPFWITSSGSSPSNGASNFSMHPRLTRLGFDYTGARIAAVDNGKLSGKLELDFLNGGSESRQIIRIRQAYFKLNWGQASFLGGQTWDVYSPLFPTVNGEAVMWNAGNLGDRRPMVRFAYEPKSGRGQWSFVSGAGLTGAVDPQDLDCNGLRDGEVSGRPDLQGRVGYTRPLWVADQPAALGVSGFYGWLNTIPPLAGRTAFTSQAINIDGSLPLTGRMSLRGEGWFGRNLSDLRGGIGQGVNTTSGLEIRSRGGWAELHFKLSKYLSVYPGLSIDDPVDRDLASGGRVRNRAFFLGNRISPSEQFVVGVDYYRWRTDYKGLPAGIDNRFNIFFQYGF
jgi:hypothetical protein